LAVARADLFDRCEVESAGEHAHAAEQAPLLLAEERIAPLHGGVKGTLRTVGAPCGLRQQGEQIVEMRRDVRRIEAGHARCRELDRERQSVHAEADFCEEAAGALGVGRSLCVRPGALSKQLNRGACRDLIEARVRPDHGQWGESVGRLAVDPQRLSARREDSKVGESRCQRGGEIGDGRHHVLAIVDHKERDALGKPARERVGVGLAAQPRQPELGRHLSRDEIDRTQRAQPNDGHSAWKIHGTRRRHRHRERGLAYASRSNQRRDRSGGDALADVPDLAVPAEEPPRAYHRQSRMRCAGLCVLRNAHKVSIALATTRGQGPIARVKEHEAFACRSKYSVRVASCAGSQKMLVTRLRGTRGVRSAVLGLPDGRRRLCVLRWASCSGWRVEQAAAANSRSLRGTASADAGIGFVLASAAAARLGGQWPAPPGDARPTMTSARSRLTWWGVQCRRQNPITLPFVLAADRESHRVSALFEETPHTRTVGFHSRRRAYSQVLATPGASAHQAQALAGHLARCHARYLNNTVNMVHMPAAALPSISFCQLVAKLDKRANSTKAKSPVLPGLFRSLRGGDSFDVPRDFCGDSRGARGLIRVPRQNVTLHRRTSATWFRCIGKGCHARPASVDWPRAVVPAIVDLMQAFEPRLPPLTTGPDSVIRVAGTRVSLETIVYAFDAGSSAEEIVEQYPTLSLSNVYAVISYALDNRQSVDEYVALRRQGTDALRAQIEKRWPAHGLRDRLLARSKKASPG